MIMQIYMMFVKWTAKETISALEEDDFDEEEDE